jgi:hypothetical protein
MWTLTQAAEQMLNTIERKILQRIYGRYKKGDAGIPDRIMNSTVYIRSKTLWRTLKLEE